MNLIMMLMLVQNKTMAATGIGKMNKHKDIKIWKYMCRRHTQSKYIPKRNAVIK